MFARDEIDRTVPLLRRTAQALCAGPDSVALGDEIVRDALRRALRADPPAAGQVRPEVWVTVILVDCARDAMARLRPQAVFAAPDPVEEGLARRVAGALAALPHELREALVLVTLSRFSYVEAAAALGLTMTDLMNRLTEARDQFASAFARTAARRSAASHLRVVK
jgi:DNA-directed RNA polymerase specialized sigma24 family protein